MNAALQLQTAIVACLSQNGDLAGVYFDAPARAPFPYVVLNCSAEKDWSSKGRRGRELTLQVALWDDQPSRLLEVESGVELTLETPDISTGWHLSTLVLTAKRRLRDPGGAWSCTLEYRARLIEAEAGAVS